MSTSVWDLFGEAWGSRRGALQVVGIVGSALCIVMSGGTAAAVCIYGAVALLGNGAQSAQDNIFISNPCPGKFVADIGVNLFVVATAGGSLAAERSAALAASEFGPLVDGGLRQVTGMSTVAGSGLSQIGCGG